MTPDIFVDLLTAFFGANHTGDQDDPWDFPPLPLMNTESDDEKASVTSAATTKSAPAAPIASALPNKKWPQISVLKDHLPDLCSLDTAIWIYPSSAKKLNETGVPEHLQVQRQQLTTRKGASVYLCQHELCKDPPYFAQSPAGLYSHVRRKHLGMALACPYCPKRLFWNMKGWSTHMEKHHPDVPNYGLQLKDEAVLASQLLEQVQEDPDSLKAAAAKEECLHPQSQPATRDRSSSSESSDSDYMPPKDSSSDSSNDSSSYSSESSTPDSTAGTHPKDSKSTSALLSLAQMEAVHEGAMGLWGEPTLESLLKYPHAWRQPLSSVLATRDWPPSQTPVA